MDKILPLLFNGKVAGEKPTRIAGDTIALELSRKTAGEFGGDYIETLHGGSFKLPTRLFADGNGSVILDSKVCTVPLSVTWWTGNMCHFHSSFMSDAHEYIYIYKIK